MENYEKVHKGNCYLAMLMGAVVIETYGLDDKDGHVLFDYKKGHGDVDHYPDDWKRYWSSPLLKYRTEWDWLMPVVEKLRGESTFKTTLNWLLSDRCGVEVTTSGELSLTKENLWERCVDVVTHQSNSPT